MSNFARNARLLWYTLATPKTNIMPVFIGPPGGGKSALFEAVARSLDAYYVDFAPAQMGPEDFAGWPTPNAERGLVFEMMWSLKQANASKRALINLDELSNVPRATQAGMLRFIHTRRCGDYVLEPHVRMGGAMNPPETATDAQDIAVALANRVAWLPWLKVGAKEHVQFMLNGGVDTDLDLPATLDPQEYADAYRDMSAIYAAFMERRGVIEEDLKDARVLARFPLAYATIRSWEAFIRVAATCRVFGDVDAMRTIGEGIIGPPQALEFAAFYLDSDIPSPEAWLKKSDLFKHDPKRPDRTFAATAALALAAVDETRASSDKEKLERWTQAWRGLEAVLKSGADKTVVALAGQTLAIKRPKGALLASVQKLIVEELAPVIKAAGFQQQF
jgi:hypothetical protein